MSSAWLAATAGVSCATPPDGAELAIRAGWPEAAPLDFVLIATIRDIHAVNGDAGTWGEVLTVRVDAVLRGSLPLSTTEVFNPPLGSPGWMGFTAGSQFLIAAHANSEESGGRITTNACAPNEEITSPDRFQQLVSFSGEPRLANTAVRRPSTLPTLGLLLVVLGVGIATATRRSMVRHASIH